MPLPTTMMYAFRAARAAGRLVSQLTADDSILLEFERLS
jgi:hypothetical protein